MNLLDAITLMYHTYNGAGFGGSGGWYTTIYVDPEKAAAMADVAVALL